jgi:hypothetical protein
MSVLGYVGRALCLALLGVPFPRNCTITHDNAGWTAFFPVPLSRYYVKSEFSAFNLLFSKTLVFVPLGFLSSLFFIIHKKTYLLVSCVFAVHVAWIACRILPIVPSAVDSGFLGCFCLRFRGPRRLPFTSDGSYGT